MTPRAWMPGVLALATFCPHAATALDPDEIARQHAMLKPQPGESRWMEVDWYPSIWEARKKAAEEGKPLFIWAGSGGAPAAGC